MNNYQIKVAREEMGMSPDQLAAIMDVRQTSETDGAIEYTRTDVTDARIKELEKELGHCIYELNRADSRKPHRDRRAGLARKALKGEKT